MDHVTLKPYPFPEGVTIPRLMPEQDKPFNGDGYLAAEVLRLRKAHNILSVVETGTCLGSTAIWLAENFEVVNSAEVDHEFWKIAILRAEKVLGMDRQGVKFYPCQSAEMLRQVWGELYWLDAHWNEHCPLLDELEAIAKANVKPCIVIHDFQVPGTDFGYDKMPDGRPFNLDLIQGHLDAIYGVGGWKHNYPTKVEGARRGWISVEPCAAPH